jgi:phage terminase large subunit-like protein
MARAAVPLNSGDFLLTLGETLKRNAKSPNINGYIPHDKQLDFHQSPAKSRLYIGGNRSGKSFGSIAECVYWLRKQHPYRAIPVGDYEGCRGRLNTVDFTNGWEKIIQPLLKQLIPPSLLIDGSWDASYRRQEHVLHCANGSFLEILSYESDLDKFAGSSRHFVAYDEEPPQEIYTENKARLIDTGGHEWFAMTPVEGMSWIYDTIYLPGMEGDPRFHITTVSMEENPHLGREEIAEFLGGLDEDERKARGEGQFIEIGGRIYKKFDPKPGGLHVLNREGMRFPKQVPIGISLDHGFNNPTAVLWHALLPEGKILTFHEHYLSGETVSYHARAIHEFNRANGIEPTILIADPSIKNTDPITGTSILQEYIKYGLPFQLANNDVKAGIERVNGYLKPRMGGEAMWHCTSDCKMLIKEMGRYKWKTYTNKKLNVRYNRWEEPHKLNDHACDSLRYFMMSRPNLEEMFADANYKPQLDTVYDDTARASTGEWSVRQINAEERRMLESEYGEYIDSSGLDLMGGEW